MTDLLPSLLKAGGIAALAIGVVYLIYREILKLGVIPRLKQWQGFALLCLLAVLVFGIAMTVLFRKASDQAQLEGELPPTSHFHLDAQDGVFCESKNVYKPFASFFDTVDINIGACDGSEQFASRTYRMDWQPSRPTPVMFAERRGYDHCFVSDFAERVPKFLQDLQSAFERNKAAIPCDVSLYMVRQVRMSYIDLRNQSREVAFNQIYNRGGTHRFEIEQVDTTNLVRSDQLEGLAQEPDSSIASDRLLAMASQYRYPDVPRQ